VQVVESRVVERFCRYLTAGAPWGRLAFHPKAKSIIEFNLWNGVDTSQEFILALRYSDDLKAKTFETFHLVRLAAGESRTEFIDVAFGSPGTFRIVMQVSSVDGEALTVTNMTVDVSWIAVYFYLLLTAAASALALSVLLALYLIKKEFTLRLS
jgi:hypothetical protein